MLRSRNAYFMQKAQLLGYENHAAFMLENRMAKTPEKVANFLQELARKLHPLKKKEEEIFLKYKKEQVSEFGGVSLITWF